MTFRTRASRPFLLALPTLLLLASPLLATDPWDAPPFSSDPKALIAAAEGVSLGESDAVVLLDEGVYSFDADGRSHSVLRMMIRIGDESAVERWGTLQAPWAPWYHEKPVIEARVVTKDGTVHKLDAKAISEAPAPEESLDIFSDNRVIRAPLPAVAVGSVIEYTISMSGNSPIADAGTTDAFVFGMPVPVQRARLVLDAPASLAPRIVNKTSLESRVEEQDGRKRTIFESKRIEALRNVEFELPYDVSPFPYIAFSTGKSWGDIARRYSEIVEKQIAAGGSLQQLVRDAVGKTKDRREVIARILAAIQKDVRYAGVELGEGSIVPRPPATVLTNKYGDCKDKATLMVAMLREAGITAHVALLRAGMDLDVSADLPGLGRFNHAIVVVDGPTPLWVDPTDEFARAGELPIQDQGRMALIASAKTTTLTAAPATPSSANRSIETRLFTLVEEGKAHVTEITEGAGADDAYQRRFYASSDRKQFRESIERYVKSYYMAKDLEKVEASDPHDLTKPFRLTVAATESRRGQTMNGEAAVVIFPGGLTEQLPWSLKVGEEEVERNDTEEEKARKTRRRVNDFVFVPFVKEWVYRITPPTGFVARQLPASETTELGTATLKKEFSTEPNGVVLAKFTFDSGKRRLTPSEFEATRKAVGELRRADGLLVGFDSIGQAKLNAGDVGGALAEFRKLTAVHPKEAQHHIELARTYLAGGMGDAAREEIRRAIELEPSNALAHRTLSQILQHDLFGRRFRKGFDLAGAITAMRKARELDPQEAGIRIELARLLEVGDDGVRFGRNNRVSEAVDEYKAIAKDLGEEGKGHEGDLLLALAHAGRFAEMKELVKSVPDQQQRELGKLLAVAATDGGAAAIREAASFDQATRRSYLSSTGQVLVSLRRYPAAVELFEAAAQGAPNAAQLRPFIEILKKTKRVEELPVADSEPKGVVTRMMTALSRGEDVKSIEQYFVVDAREESNPEASEDEEEQSNASALSRLEATAAKQNMPLNVLTDLGMSVINMQQDGDEKSGYRIRTRPLAGGPGAAAADMTLYVVREDGQYRIAAMRQLPDLIGRAVLRFADKGELETARTWLNWAREDISVLGGEDPLASPPFASLWPKSKPTATLEEVRTAAASLMIRKSSGKLSAPVLTELREKAPTDEARIRIDVALAQIHTFQRDWARLVPIAERLATAYPDSSTAFTAWTTALTYVGKTADANAVAKKRLERMPKDRDALRALSVSAAQARDYVAAEKFAQQVIDELTPTAGDYNNAAWYALFAGRDLDHALQNARQATSLTNSGDPASLHTLAALYAETGKSLEAREALLTSMDENGRDEPASSDWYVLGRIAENYGAREAALAAYKRVKDDDRTGGSVYELTERRLAAMKR